MNKTIDAPGHEKKHFPFERIAFFSDAITAIASTLLILDLKYRHWAGITPGQKSGTCMPAD